MNAFSYTVRTEKLPEGYKKCELYQLFNYFIAVCPRHSGGRLFAESSY